MSKSQTEQLPALRPQALETLRYQAILDTARDAIISIDRSGTVTDYNQAAETMFGYTAAEVVGRDVSMLMPSPYREEHAGYVRNYQRTGEKKAIGRIREVEALRKNGEIFPIELAVSEARVGNEVLYTAIIRDVSALHRAKAWAEARYEITRVLAVSDTLTDAARPMLEAIRKLGKWDVAELWVLDHAGEELRRIAVTSNQAFAACELVAGSPGVRLALGEGLIGRVCMSGQADSLADVSADSSFVRKDAAARAGLKSAFAFPVRDENAAVAVMAFYAARAAEIDAELGRLVASLGRQIGDFIARKRTEEELRTLESSAHERARLADIGAITAKLVHDLGNPLSGISMQTELLQRKAKRDDVPANALLQPIERILTGVARLKDLVRGFTDFAREQRLDLTQIDLHPFLTDVVEHWRPVAGAKNVRLEANVPDVLPLLTADEGKLRRVFDNVLRNAIEAIEKDGVVTVGVAVPADGKISIAIADTGAGLPPGVEIFKLFETTKPQGTGIGLPVSKEIVSAHGGGIQFAPNRPCGTIFTIELPLGGPGAG